MEQRVYCLSYCLK